MFRGVVLPWRVDLWKPKGHAGPPRYRKLTDMAAQMIRDFAASQGVKVRVLFDAFYLCPGVTNACVSKGFTFFSVAQRGRNFTTPNGKRRKIARLMPGLIRHRGRTVRMTRARGRHATLRIAAADGHLGRIGRVRMVVSKRPRGPWKKCIAVVTNETGLRPRQTIAAYETRWLIEVLFKELHQDLGLGDYQVLHRRRDPATPAPVPPGPSAADPPVPRTGRCKSDQPEPAGRHAADEPAPGRTARRRRQGPDPRTLARRQV
jgi:DDE family transposase